MTKLFAFQDLNSLLKTMNALKILLPKVIQNPSIKFSTSSRLGCQIKEWGTPLQQSSFTVPSFGGSVNVNSQVDTFVKPANSEEYPNLDRASVKLYSKIGHNKIVVPKDLEGRTVVQADQIGNNLKVHGKAGNKPEIDALVVEVHMYIILKFAMIFTENSI